MSRFTAHRMAAITFVAMVASLTVAMGASAASPRALDATAVAESSDVLASRDFMSQYGVSRKVQDRLLAQATRGKVLLADTPAAVPVRTAAKDEGTAVSTVSTYEDGSISVVTREKPREIKAGVVTPFSVTGCSFVSGSGYASYSNCKVHYRTTVFSYGFYANFSITSGYDAISNAYGFFQQYAIGHSRISDSLRVLKATESSTGPAHAELAIEYKVLGGVGGQITKGVRLKVGGNQYWQE